MCLCQIKTTAACVLRHRQIKNCGRGKTLWNMIILCQTETLHILYTPKWLQLTFIKWEQILRLSRYPALEQATILNPCLNSPHWCSPEVGAFAIMMNYQSGLGHESWSSRWNSHNVSSRTSLTFRIECHRQPHQFSFSNNLTFHYLIVGLLSLTVFFQSSFT